MATFEKQHNSYLTEVFSSKEEFDRHESMCEIYKSQFDEIKEALLNEGFVANDVFSSFCPELQYIRMDMLKKEDWPYHIDRNSIYLLFSIDMKAKMVEIHTCGHIYLSEADMKKSCLVMCSMRQAHQAVGGKWFRKSRYKSAADLAKRMLDFYHKVKQTMETVTDGYPYKQMTIDIY